jgi:hypothetical protein
MRGSVDQFPVAGQTRRDGFPAAVPRTLESRHFMALLRKVNSIELRKLLGLTGHELP